MNEHRWEDIKGGGWGIWSGIEGDHIAKVENSL